MTAVAMGLDGVDLGPGPFTIAALSSLDPADLCESALVETVGLIDEQIAWLCSVRAGHLAVLADRHAAEPADDGKEWEREAVAARCAISGWESARRVRAAVDLHSGRLPAAAAALRAGAISWRHAEALSVQTGDLPEAEAQRVERRVLADDRVVTARQFETRARKLASAFDPHPEETPDPSLTVGSAVCGSVRFEAWLPEPDAAVVMTALDALATPAGPEDRRPVGWRRADALVELCRGALDAGLGSAAASGVRPHLTLLADAADWAAGRSVTLAGVGSLPDVELHPATAREITCDAGVTVATHRDGRLDTLDAERRLPGPALRRRLEARDQGCRFPGCTRVARRCHAHHVVHWADGGPTVEDNLLLVCARHHHAVHDGSWRLAFDGTTASWTDPHGRPYEHRSPLVRPPDPPDAWPTTAPADALATASSRPDDGIPTDASRPDDVIAIDARGPNDGIEADARGPDDGAPVDAIPTPTPIPMPIPMPPASAFQPSAPTVRPRPQRARPDEPPPF